MKNFINLTNGIDWINELDDFSFIRIESTAIEKDDWCRVFRDLDANLLMNLALGERCCVYDCHPGKKDSKTIRVGIPKIIDFLEKMWIHKQAITANTRILKEMKRKISYYSRFVLTDQIHLTGKSKWTQFDGEVDYFRCELSNFFYQTARSYERS